MSTGRHHQPRRHSPEFIHGLPASEKNMKLPNKLRVAAPRRRAPGIPAPSLQGRATHPPQSSNDRSRVRFGAKHENCQTNSGAAAASYDGGEDEAPGGPR